MEVRPRMVELKALAIRSGMEEDGLALSRV
jgi:hypothetical protein